MALITAEARAELIALYVGMFKAAPSADTLSQMVAAKEGGQTVLQIANTLAGATKLGFANVYPGLQTAEEFAATLTGALLAPDIPAAAKTWATNWVISQVTGTKTRVQVIVEAVQAIRATTNPNYASSKAQLTNKVAVAQYYAVDKNLSDPDLIDLQGVVMGVTADAATVTTGKAAVDVIAADAQKQTFNLTIGTDTIVGSGGNDIINASTGLSADGTTAIATTNALDSIDGGAGIDTLKIENTGGKNTLTGSITNVENLTFIGAGNVNNNAAISLTSYSGTFTLQQTDDTAVSVTGVGSQTVAINKVADTTNVSVAGTGATVNLSNTSSLGDATFTVTGATVTAANVSTNATAAGKSLIVDNTGNTVKTATIAASGAAAVTVNSTALEAVVVSGAGRVTLTAGTAPSKSIDASASTGGITYAVDLVAQQFTGGTGGDRVQFGATTKAQTLGGGDDTATISAALGTGGSIDAGEGTGDVLKMTATLADTLDASTVFNGKVSNFEKLSLTAATAETLDLTNLDGLSYVIEAGNGATLTLNNMASGGTLEMTDASTTTVIGIKDAATGTADVFNSKLTAAASTAFGTVTVASTETVNINSDDTAVAPLKDGSVIHSLTLTADKATSVVVSGDAALNLTLTGSTKITSINASTNEAGLTTNLSVASGITLIGTAKADTVTVGALSVITGGAGNDNFIVTAPANGSSYATITDAAKGDILTLVDKGTETFATTKLSLADTAVFQDYLDAATAGDGSTNGAISWFQFGGNTYVVEDVSAAATFQNAVDVVIKLTGLIDLSTADLVGNVLTVD